jgi:hypothetical protein
MGWGQAYPRGKFVLEWQAGLQILFALAILTDPD